VYTYVTLALPVREQHEADCAEQADPHHPLVALNPSLVTFREEADRAQGCREEDLQGQDRVDLSDKLHANREGRFCDGAAKLGFISWMLLSWRYTWCTYLEVIGHIVVLRPGISRDRFGLV
jgi:hypothetical protein